MKLKSPLLLAVIILFTFTLNAQNKKTLHEIDYNELKEQLLKDNQKL